MGRQVQAMFADIATRYDRTNTVLSLGVHKAWRRRTVAASGAGPGDRVLDVATGTGDLAFAFRRRVGPGRVVGADFTGPMLHQAQRKAAGRGPVDWAQADALALPFPDDAVDVASIAFGIRNVDDPAKGIAEMARCVRPGGRVVVLEFGRPRGPIGVPYRWYARHVMPRIGALLTGNREAYAYLPETAAAFPCGQAFADIMRSAGLDDVQVRPLTGGIAWLYSGVA